MTCQTGRGFIVNWSLSGLTSVKVFQSIPEIRLLFMADMVLNFYWCELFYLFGFVFSTLYTCAPIIQLTLAEVFLSDQLVAPVYNCHHFLATRKFTTHRKVSSYSSLPCSIFSRQPCWQTHLSRPVTGVKKPCLLCTRYTDTTHMIKKGHHPARTLVSVSHHSQCLT